MGLFGGKQFSDEEVAILLELIEERRKKNRREESQKLLAVPKYTLFPGKLRPVTVETLERLGCRVDWIDEAHGHGVVTPKGSRYYGFMQVVYDLQPELRKKYSWHPVIADET